MAIRQKYLGWLPSFALAVVLAAVTIVAYGHYKILFQQLPIETRNFRVENPNGVVPAGGDLILSYEAKRNYNCPVKVQRLWFNETTNDLYTPPQITGDGRGLIGQGWVDATIAIPTSLSWKAGKYILTSYAIYTCPNDVFVSDTITVEFTLSETNVG